MYKTNKERIKQLILINPDIRKLYYFMIILLILLVIFILVVILFEQIIIAKQNQIKRDLFGDWDIICFDFDKKDISYFENNVFIDNYSMQYVQEKVFLDKDQRVIIGSTDDNFLELGNIKLLEGRMPNSSGEVAVEEQYLHLLEVDRIGDVIPLNSPISSLVGYKVCGIISNYSDRWKRINWDVKFINCFIKFSKENANQIFVSSSSMLKKDIQKNMLYYRLNVSSSAPNLLYMFVPLILIILMIELVLYMTIHFKINKCLNLSFMKQEQLFDNENIKYLIFILEIILAILLVLYVTNLIKDSNVYDKLNEGINQNENILNTVINKDNVEILLKSDENIKEFGVLKVLSSKSLSLYLMKEISFIILILLNNYLIILLNKFRVKYINLLNYYYGERLVIQKILKKEIFYFMIHVVLSIFIITLLFRDISFLVIVLNITLVIICNLILRFLRLCFYIKWNKNLFEIFTKQSHVWF